MAQKLAYAMFTNMATSYDEQPGFFGADEFVAGQYFRDNMAAYGPAIYIGDGLQMAQNPYCNIWSKDGAYLSHTLLQLIHRQCRSLPKYDKG